MRRSFIVAYDVREPSRLRQVGSFMLGFGDRIQYSVFFCRLSKLEKARMLWQLNNILAPEDAFWVISLCKTCGKHASESVSVEKIKSYKVI
jgi:CRISPR-associated protein Cas2